MESNQRWPSYYTILGVSTDASDDQIRRAYRKLAMRWHPDKWTKTPSLLGKARRKFQQIQEAYSVLADQRKRTMYDAGLYDPHDEEEDEGFADFLQEMMSLMENDRREEKNYSFGEIQSMFWEMVQSFDFPEWSDSPRQTLNESSQWSHGTFNLDDSRTSKRARMNINPVAEEDLHFPSIGRAKKHIGGYTMSAH